MFKPNENSNTICKPEVPSFFFFVSTTLIQSRNNFITFTRKIRLKNRIIGGSRNDFRILQEVRIFFFWFFEVWRFIRTYRSLSLNEL